MNKKEKNDIATMIDGANELTELMYNFFKKNNRYQPFTFGIVGHATELFMKFMADQINEDYDKLSEDYTDYLRIVHNDVKNMNIEDEKAN